jgi:hypothetical protein
VEERLAAVDDEAMRRLYGTLFGPPGGANRGDAEGGDADESERLFGMFGGNQGGAEKADMGGFDQLLRCCLDRLVVQIEEMLR